MSLWVSSVCIALSIALKPVVESAPTAELLVVIVGQKRDGWRIYIPKGIIHLISGTLLILRQQVMKERISYCRKRLHGAVDIRDTGSSKMRNIYVVLRSKFDKMAGPRRRKNFQGPCSFVMCRSQVLVHQSSVNAKPQVIGVRCDERLRCMRI